ncbi:MAG TPA: efflux RND transporter periplasmic adaptor subunit [Rhodocyclaceae bacterium]
MLARIYRPITAIAAVVVVGVAITFGMRGGAPVAADAPAPSARPALTVSATQPRQEMLPLRISANGNIAAWHEAVVGTEANGLRVADVRVNVGDRVRRGQVLATFAAATTIASFEETRAAVAEAEATLAEAEANAKRARGLQAKGFLSPQAINQYLTAETTARARLDAQRAALQTKQLHVEQTRVVAPDDGIISARSVTVGAVLPAGQELFRLIRQGRLEWRAEVAAPDLVRLKPGMAATVTPAGGEAIRGSVRMVGPTVDAQTRNGLVYVDLPDPGAARAGMFARGEFEVGSAQALTLPQGAVVLREGFAYVLRLGDDSKVVQTKVSVGRRLGDRVEIVAGLDAGARVVASGGAFLGDGDTVRVVEDQPSGAK